MCPARRAEGWLQTHTAEELRGQPQVVVQGQECHPLQPHHDDLQAGNKEAAAMGLDSPTLVLAFRHNQAPGYLKAFYEIQTVP